MGPDLIYINLHPITTVSHTAAWLSARVQVAMLVLVASGLVPLVVLLGQLLGFHVRLRLQGLSTYEFIVRETKKRRAREEKAVASRELVAMASRQQPSLLAAAKAPPAAAAEGHRRGGDIAPPSAGSTKPRQGSGEGASDADGAKGMNQRKVVLTSSSSSSSALSSQTAKPNLGGGRLPWPFRGLLRSRQPPQSLPGDEFLVMHPDEATTL